RPQPLQELLGLLLIDLDAAEGAPHCGEPQAVQGAGRGAVAELALQVLGDVPAERHEPDPALRYPGCSNGRGGVMGDGEVSQQEAAVAVEGEAVVKPDADGDDAEPGNQHVLLLPPWQGLLAGYLAGYFFQEAADGQSPVTACEAEGADAFLTLG